MPARFLPPTTPSVMANYKEPLKPVTGGYGYLGTLAYDESKQFTQCHLCGNFYPNLGTHVAKAHEISSRMYREAMGLPIKLSLQAPNAPKSAMFERWAKMDEKAKKQHIQKMRDGHYRPGAKVNNNRRHSLYKKNLQGACPDQLLDKIEAMVKKLGRTPTYREFSEHYGKKYTKAIEVTYGTWGQALDILSLAHPQRGPQGNFYSDEALVEMLVDFKDRHGREATATDVRKRLMPGLNTYIRHFGSWQQAKDTAYGGKQ